MIGIALRDTGFSVSDLSALARAADDSGYHSIWVPEVGSRDALSLAALFGSHTRRSLVATGVVPVFSRNIVSLAMATAAAYEASGGRFVLGLGAGHRFTAEAWFGADWKRPRTRLRETVEVLRRILAGERVSHDGSFHVENFHLDTRPLAVPIYLAALTPASLRLAGEVADGALLNWLHPEGMERAALLVREAAADADRRVKVFGYVRAAVVDEPDAEEAAATAAREHTYSYVGLPAYANSLRQMGFGEAIDRLHEGDEQALETLTRSLCLVGDASTVRVGLERFRSSGLDGVIVYPVPYGDDPAHSVLRTLRATCAAIAAVD